MSENTSGGAPAPLTVSQAAAALGVSERTVQRRCKRGRLAARLESGADGAAWLIDPDRLPTLPTGAAKLPTGADTGFESETAQSVGTLPTGADTAAIAADNAQSLQMARMQGFMAGQMEAAIARAVSAANAPLIEEIQLLRGEIEAMKQSSPQGPRAAQTATMGNQARPAANAAHGGIGREARPLWKVILGVR